MRILGTVQGQTRAETLVAHLLTRDIQTYVEQADGQSDHWEVWVRDEDRLPLAKTEYEVFLTNPDDPAYAEAVGRAQEMVAENRRRQSAATKNQRVFNRKAINRQRVPPLTLTLTILSTALSLLSQFSSPDPGNRVGRNIVRRLMFVDIAVYPEKTADPSYSLKKGEIWRAITPIFLHGTAPHLLFNMIMLVSLGQILERRESALGLAILVLISALIPNLFQALSPTNWGGTPIFVGFSGVLYGMFGYVWVKSTLRPDLIPTLSPISVIIMLGWLVLCFTGRVGPIANLAHLGGLIVGALAGWLAANWRPNRSLLK